MNLNHENHGRLLRTLVDDFGADIDLHAQFTSFTFPKSFASSLHLDSRPYKGLPVDPEGIRRALAAISGDGVLTNPHAER